MCPGISDIKEHFIETIASNRVVAFSPHNSKGQRGERLVRCHGGNTSHVGAGKALGNHINLFLYFPQMFYKTIIEKTFE